MITPNLLSGSLNDIVKKVIDTPPEYGYVEITCTLRTSTTPKLEILVYHFDNYDLVQNFEGTYVDFVNIEFRLSPKNYMEIMKSPEKLTCVLKFYKFDIKTSKRQEELFSKTYLMIIADKNDLLKKYPYKSLLPEKKGNSKDTMTEGKLAQTIPMRAQLIPPEEYALRKIKLNIIYRDVTIKDVIIALANEFNMKKLWLVEPDNKKKYTNFIIPPMLGISNIFNYLQEDSGKGIYSKGFNYYVSDNTMYVYPRWNSKEMSKQVVHIYKIPESTLMGVDNYHINDSGTRHILTNTETKDAYLLDESVENIGTSLLAMKCEDLVDQWRTTLEGDQYRIHSDNMIHVHMDDTIGTLVKQPYQPNYVQSEENIFRHESILSFGNGIIMETGWSHAIPYTFKPGWPVYYHYAAEGGKYAVLFGTCINVIYSAIRIPNIRENVFGLSAKMTLRFPAYTRPSDNSKVLEELNGTTPDGVVII